MNKVYKKVSVVIPIYNEGKLLPELLDRLTRALSSLKISYELIFVDDHSTDETSSFFARNKKSFVIYQKKLGKSGKAYSLIQGFKTATGDVLCMIDGDLQYPPEEIPGMIEKLQSADIVVAHRKDYKGTKIRRMLSSGFRFVFGKLMFGLNYDIQSGLKVFTREVLRTVQITPTSGWTFDLQFLHKSKEAGFTIVNHPISFNYRKEGESKIGFVKTSVEIGMDALRLKGTPIHPQHIPPRDIRSMAHAGIGYKKKKYITHTTLPHQITAMRTVHVNQKFTIVAIILAIVSGLIFTPLQTAIWIIGILSFIYFIDVLFNLYLVLRSLHVPQEVSFSAKEIEKLTDKSLPIYTILCPLYKEAHVIPQFVSAIEKIEWPKNKLDVQLLLEEDDTDSIHAVAHMKLPSYVRTVVVPVSMPKTKPKACNYGLSQARGEYLVIYDAEDIPDPLQLKKAYLAFEKLPRHVLCLQAKLNYYNSTQNLLTRFFTAEYSLWFDVTLTGLQSIDTAIPLGGTSNHFRTRDLQMLRGWDPFNVTEDADLGIRLFKKGYKTAMLDSTTFEEANTSFFNWMRQRSRWLKGYMQTYLVHMRQIGSFAKRQKFHALIFQLVIGGKIAFTLINPILWIATISYFALYAYVGPTIEQFYPSVVFYMAASSLVFGNFLFLYYYMIGCFKREQYDLVKYIFLVPIYWLMISIACVIALYQLIFKPHYWEKTVHGLHLLKKAKKIAPDIVIDVVENKEHAAFPPSFKERFSDAFASKKAYVGGGSLVIASVAANLLNFFFNAYLGRVLDLGSFALVNLISSFLYISQIPFSALGSVVNYRTGFLSGRYKDQTAEKFKQWIRGKAFMFSLVLCTVWVVGSPFLRNFFSAETITPFYLFAPVWILGMITAVDRGYLSGKFMFTSLAVVALAEPVAKLIATYAFVQTNQVSLVYMAIPISILVSFLIASFLSHQKKKELTHKAQEVFQFPVKFFIATFMSGLSTIAFLSLDIILATRYLSPEDAGRYGLISLVGKMIFFLATLAQQFITPVVAQREGAKKNSDDTFNIIFLASFVLSAIGFVCLGLFGHITVPLLYGPRAESIIFFLPFFCLAMVLFSMSRVFVIYHQAKNLYSFSVVAFALAAVQVLLIQARHANIQEIVLAMLIVSGLNLVSMAILHFNVGWVKVFENNLTDLFALFFEKQKASPASTKNLRILIVNWRDTKHVWAGGAEVYLHEIAKRLVDEGHVVTLFCGNDGHNKRNQVIDGVRIVRRGGSYTVYAWAFLYYILRFRGNYDVIVDSENGIPFFTPIYARIPVLLLIHHVHQNEEIFKGRLIFPFTHLARFMEAKLMPWIYKNNTIITVSDSTKKEILKLGLAHSKNVEIVNPGVKFTKSFNTRKTKHPSFLYLGRLKPYKNIDIGIQAFARVIKLHPNAQLSIVGEGEMIDPLITLVQHLRISDQVTFYGKVTEKEKLLLLSQSWVVLQPSELEGWGITVIEANAGGTPVIASNVPGLRDSIVNEQTGMLVPVRDIDAFAKTMIALITKNQLRRTLSENAYTWSSNFTWERSADKFIRIIQSTIERDTQYKDAVSFELAKKI